MDTEVWASGPQEYEVRVAGGPEVVGRILIAADASQQATVEAVAGSALEGVAPGPYPSRSTAMETIGAHMRGNCDMGGYIQR
jgi:hypothetical protein